MEFLKISGALVVNFSAAGATSADSLAAAVSGEVVGAAQQGRSNPVGFRTINIWNKTLDLYVTKHWPRGEV